MKFWLTFASSELYTKVMVGPGVTRPVKCKVEYSPHERNNLIYYESRNLNTLKDPIFKVILLISVEFISRGLKYPPPRGLHWKRVAALSP